MEIMKKETKPLFRIDIKEYSTKKIKGFNVYEGKKISLMEFTNKMKEKVKEI